jgi:hypothetical protein
MDVGPRAVIANFRLPIADCSGQRCSRTYGCLLARQAQIEGSQGQVRSEAKYAAPVIQTQPAARNGDRHVATSLSVGPLGVSFN